jgi:hypothetical protein
MKYHSTKILGVQKYIFYEIKIERAQARQREVGEKSKPKKDFYSYYLFFKH